MGTQHFTNRKGLLAMTSRLFVIGLDGFDLCYLTDSDEIVSTLAPVSNEERCEK